MELSEVARRLGLDIADPGLSALCGRLDGAAPGDWRRLAAAIARSVMPGSASGVRWPAWDRVPAPLVLGIAGPQGSGKSTLAGQLERALAAAGARPAACSLDDFYLSRARRRELAREVHPLLATRGVPGTHDVALLRRVIAELGGSGSVHLPRFDKGVDDVMPRAQWRRLQAPVDVVVLEGWCVGAAAQPPGALVRPANELEAREDADGAWRRYVNDALAGPYAALWRCLHGLVYLQVPDLDAVLRWRGEQERALPPAQRMSPAALRRFIAHYQRITVAMQADMPGRADLLVRLDEDHTVSEICVK